MIILTILFFLLSGGAEGVMDHLQFHYDKHNVFWNPKLSWVNKYKFGNPIAGERFFLSTTILVWLTDGWHLMKMIRTTTLTLGIAFLLTHLGISFWLSAIYSTLAVILFKLAFTAVYNILKK